MARLCNPLSHTSQGWVLFLNNTIYRHVVFYSIIPFHLIYKKTLFKSSYWKLVDWELSHTWELLDIGNLGPSPNLQSQEVTGPPPGSSW